jgi:hypothetical protein
VRGDLRVGFKVVTIQAGGRCTALVLVQYCSNTLYCWRGPRAPMGVSRVCYAVIGIAKGLA